MKMSFIDRVHTRMKAEKVAKSVGLWKSYVTKSEECGGYDLIEFLKEFGIEVGIDTVKVDASSKYYGDARLDAFC